MAISKKVDITMHFKVLNKTNHSYYQLFLCIMLKGKSVVHTSYDVHGTQVGHVSGKASEYFFIDTNLMRVPAKNVTQSVKRGLIAFSITCS